MTLPTQLLFLDLLFSPDKIIAFMDLEEEAAVLPQIHTSSMQRMALQEVIVVEVVDAICYFLIMISKQILSFHRVSLTVSILFSLP